MGDVKLGIIGGSGLGQALLDRQHADAIRHQIETPFGKPSDNILQIDVAGLPVLLLSRHGPGHLFNPSEVPYRANIFALKQLGCTHVIASGAVGSLRDGYKPRDLVIADQIIDQTHRRAGTFFDRAAVHAEFAEPFCPLLRRALLNAASGLQSDPAQGGEPFNVHDRGCYVCMEGPAFSTRAQSLMHRLWGGDLIGMTAMPEAKLAREAEMRYALVALVTDYDCWRRPPQTDVGTGQRAPAGDAQAPAPADPPPPDPAVLLKEIIANLSAASENAIRLILRTIEQIAADPARVGESPAHRALELAIWSDKSRIAPDEVRRLGPLWGRYF